MTVSYTADVGNVSRFGCFTKILRRWKGSVYKLIFKELAAYLCCYYLLNVIYRYFLHQPGVESYRRSFEGITAYCSIQMTSIPMTFCLGFYVSIIIKRWWDQYLALPWPDSLAIYIAGLLHGQDERGRMMRRNIMRYTLLSYVIVLRRISFRVRKRFPTMDHVVNAGLMRSDELKVMEALDEKCTVSKWWMPLVWATSIIMEARKEKRFRSDRATVNTVKEVTKIQDKLIIVQHYDTISVPLVYTQVVSWSIYSYFLVALMGAQWVRPEHAGDFEKTHKLPTFSLPDEPEGSESVSAPVSINYQGLDLYFPFFLTLQFIFYVGWMKVAETLINPFGEDDDDFELNYLIDRHIQVAYMTVDDMQQNYPELLKDMHWNQTEPIQLPYTKETEKCRKEEPKGSAEQREESDSQYQAYYSALKSKMGSNKNLDSEYYSDYEAVDASSLFGKFKSKLRKSQLRKSSRSNASSIYFRPKMPLAKSIDGDLDVDSKPLSTVSRKSSYASMWSIKFPGRQRRKTVSDIPQHENRQNQEGEEDTNEFFKKYDKFLSVSPENQASTDASSPTTLEHPGNLSTIAESQSSMSSKSDYSRRNSMHPKLDSIFDLADHMGHIAAYADSGAFDDVISVSEYYPVDRVEYPQQKSAKETSNYEPILFGRLPPGDEVSTVNKSKNEKEKTPATTNATTAATATTITTTRVDTESAFDNSSFYF